MPPKQRSKAVLASQSREVSIGERVAWYSLLVVPAAVPVATAKMLFSGAAPWAYNLFVYPKIFVLSWLVGVAALAWTTGVVLGHIETRSVPLKWWLLGFLGLASVSTVFAMNPTTSFFGGRYHAVGLLVLLLVGAVTFLATQLVTGSERLRVLSWSTVAGGVGVAVVGLLQVIGFDPLAPTAGPSFIVGRGASLLGNPDFTGTYLVFPMLIAAGLTIAEGTKGQRAVAATSFVLVASAMVATLTRGAWVGGAVGLVLLGVAVARSEVKPAKSVYAVLAAALIVPVLLIAREPIRALRQLAGLAGGGTSGGGRLILWKDALAVVARHPLFGTGPDAYRLGWYPVRSVASVKLSGLTSITEDPHNIILLLMATIGIPAAIAAVGFVGASISASASAALEKDVPARRLIYTGWWAAAGALCVALVFATNTASVASVLFLALGVLAAARSKAVEYPAAARYALVAGLTVLAITAIGVSTVSLSADTTLMRAQTSPNRLALLQQAASTAPWYAEAVSQANEAYGEAALTELQNGSAQGTQDAATAEKRFRDAVAANPHEYKNWAALSSFLNNAGDKLGGDALRRAVTAAIGALDVYPVSSEAAYLKATAQIGLGDAAAAVQTLEPLWDIDPAYPEPGIIYAEALLRSGDQAKAASVAGELVRRFPDNPDVAQLAARVRAGSAK
jgi:putative inorganic carbon (hco3(-)) transporter